MTSALLAEVTRGGIVESRHTGIYVVVDAKGRLIDGGGDVNRAIFPRSAIKAIQALPFVESGAAAAFGFGNKELALACASHSGEPAHADLAQSMLAAAGLSEQAMECGVHWPTNLQAAAALSEAHSRPSQLHNNCSGKHAGFLCTCVHEGDAPSGYVGKQHRQQERVRVAMEEVTGARHDPALAGVDGCSIPTYAAPLQALAHGFARMATGEGFSPARANAAQALIQACMAEPFMVAGTGRACTRLMQAAPIFAKTGAEGVYCAAIPEMGLGIALKIDDGATRAAEVAIAALLAKHSGKSGDALMPFSRQTLSNWNGIEVGQVRAAGVLPVS